ncbi:MAG TPA: alpha/beta hydrolase [Candidatus Binatia bacterium]|jgi:pimeloyl-ACP methyl ester carboxylesterase
MKYPLAIMAVVSVLVGCALTRSGAPQIKQVSINGAKLTYQEQGQGRPVVFVHGAITDYRVWEGQREAVSAHLRFIALTMRYFGTEPWPDAGVNYSMKTHSDDLVAFIQNLNVGPVDLVGWSYSGPIALLVAVHHPELVHSLFLHEPATLALVADESELQAATKDRTAMTAPALAAVKAGDTAGAVKSLFNGVNGQPDLFDTVPPLVRTMLLDNARTLPISSAAPPPPAITCEQLGKIKVPTTIAVGELTRPFYKIAATSVAQCIPGAKLVVIPKGRHAAPVQATSEFNDALLRFLTGN